MTVSWATRFASCRQRWTRAGYLQTAERCVPNRLSAGGWLANERHRTCPWQPDVMTRQSRGSRLVCHARASLCTRHFARREGLPLAMCTYSTTGCASSLQPPYPPPLSSALFSLRRRTYVPSSLQLLLSRADAPTRVTVMCVGGKWFIHVHSCFPSFFGSAIIHLSFTPVHQYFT